MKKEQKTFFEVYTIKEIEEVNAENKEDKIESLSKKPIKTGAESNISMFSIIICIASFAISVDIFIQLTKKKW
mgnify:CR=1 FL=1